MIRIRDIALPPGHGEGDLTKAAARILRVGPEDITGLSLVRRSLDARDKSRIRWVYTVDLTVTGDEARILRRAGAKAAPAPCPEGYRPPDPPAHPPALPPVVVGFGPAGMFAALILAQAGLRPLVIERGRDVETRQAMVEDFWATGRLDPQCNVQFGEGGAGTFSDGKLNTGTHNPRNRWILEQLAAFGAGRHILVDAKPHVGTDVLRGVVANLRRRVEALGGQVRFATRLTGLSCRDGRLTGITVDTPGGGETMDCTRLILAIGHSARDTFAALLAAGVPMEAKPFAMGARIEHLQLAIDRSQYGDVSGLPPADYKLVHHLAGRSVYTFCMCPGGYVVAAASEPGGVVTNGMSYASRAGVNANSALLVSVQPKDFPYPGPLGGMQWQRELEGQAFSPGYLAPAQRVEDFLLGRPTTGFGDVRPTYRPGVIPGKLPLPEVLARPMAAAISAMDGKLRGFAHPDAVLTGPETRSSSPVRILRDERGQSALAGLFPCGEGAGYAGGIVSAAADGVRCAEALLQSLENGGNAP